MLKVRTTDTCGAAPQPTVSAAPRHAVGLPPAVLAELRQQLHGHGAGAERCGPGIAQGGAVQEAAPSVPMRFVKILATPKEHFSALENHYRLMRSAQAIAEVVHFDNPRDLSDAGYVVAKKVIHTSCILEVNRDTVFVKMENDYVCKVEEGLPASADGVLSQIITLGEQLSILNLVARHLPAAQRRATALFTAAISQSALVCDDGRAFDYSIEQLQRSAQQHLSKEMQLYLKEFANTLQTVHQKIYGDRPLAHTITLFTKAARLLFGTERFALPLLEIIVRHAQQIFQGAEANREAGGQAQLN